MESPSPNLASQVGATSPHPCIRRPGAPCWSADSGPTGGRASQISARPHQQPRSMPRAPLGDSGAGAGALHPGSSCGAGSPAPATSAVTPSHCSAHPAWYTFACTALDATQERFASPLNFDHGITGATACGISSLAPTTTHTHASGHSMDWRFSRHAAHAARHLHHCGPLGTGLRLGVRLDRLH